MRIKEDTHQDPSDTLRIQNLTTDWPAEFDVGEIPANRKKLAARMEELGVTHADLEAIYDQHFDKEDIFTGNALPTIYELRKALGGDGISAHYFFYANFFRNNCNEYIQNLWEVAAGRVCQLDAIRMEKECKKALSEDLAGLAVPEKDFLLQGPIDEFTRGIKASLRASEHPR